MTTDNTKQNLTDEVAIGNEAELHEETLEQLSGGVGPRCGLPNKRIKRPTIPEEPKDGGATSSW